MRANFLSWVVVAILCCTMTVPTVAAQDDFGGGEFGGQKHTQEDNQRNSLVSQMDLTAEMRELRRIYNEADVSPADAKSAVSEKVETTFEMSAAMKKLHGALDTKTDFDFEDTTLADVAVWFEEKLGINVEVDAEAMSDEGIDGDTEPIRFQADKMSCRAALGYMLSELSLSYTISNEVLLITSADVAEETLHARIYPVWDLVRTADASTEVDPQAADYDTLIQLITSIVLPNSWDEVGGPGSISSLKGMLIVSNTQDAHDEIVSLLHGLRSFPRVTSERPKAVKVMDLSMSTVKTMIRQKLDEPINLEFNATLNHLVEYVRDIAQIHVQFDRNSLDEESIDPSLETVSISLQNVSLRSALRLCLKPLNLTFVPHAEALVITSQEQAEETLSTRVYQCGALLDTNDARDFFGLGDELVELKGVISATVLPNSWDEVGGPGAIVIYPDRGLLVVSNVEECHREIQSVLETLARSRSGGNAAPRKQATKPSEVTVVAYPLPEDFVSPEAQQQLSVVLTGMLQNASGDPMNNTQVDFLGSRMIVSGRRDVHQVLAKVLMKLGAAKPVEDGGMMGDGMGGGMGGGMF